MYLDFNVIPWGLGNQVGLARLQVVQDGYRHAVVRHVRRCFMIGTGGLKDLRAPEWPCPISQQLAP